MAWHHGGARYGLRLYPLNLIRVIPAKGMCAEPAFFPEHSLHSGLKKLHYLIPMNNTFCSAGDYVMKISRVATIAGSDSGGGAGIQADLKTISALGGFGMSVITALTAQNTLGVQGIFEVPPDFIAQQFNSVMSDIGVDAAKTGMLATPEILSIVSDKIREFNIENLVVDPVMVAKGGARLLSDKAEHTMIDQLIPLSMVITPNIPEAEVLTSTPIKGVDEMKRAAEMIHAMGARNVVVKGGHLSGDAVDVLYDGNSFHEIHTERIATKNTHGTGCTFSAAVATGLASGLSVLQAVTRAKEYVTTAIRFSLELGSGHGPTNHFAEVMNEREKFICIESLERAFRKLHRARCGNIIPEIQSNLGYALPCPSKESHVAAFRGRLIRSGNHITKIHDPSFGASHHIARIILTVMDFDNSFRSAMNIRYSGEIIRACESLSFSIDSFNRSSEPEDIRIQEGASLPWGVREVLSSRPDIPDIIYDTGDIGKEPIVRILGKNPGEVAEKVILISEYIKQGSN